MGADRTLTVACYGGLANRLRVLTSAVVLAEATGRALTFHWHQMETLGAAYDQLFTNQVGVVNFPGPPAERLPFVSDPLGRDHIDVLASTEPHLAFTAVTWLVRPDYFPDHAALLPRCGELLGQWQPIPALADRIAAFQRQHFRPPMIGVHLRRGDFHRVSGYSVHNTQTALQAVQGFLRTHPDAGIFLCTDDGFRDPVTGQQRVEGAREIFRRAFGDRVVWQEPRALDRADPLAVQDALVDLWLLRACDLIVGTWTSSFSELAAFGRPVPVVYTRSGGLAGLLDRFGQRVGLWPALNRLAGRITSGRTDALNLYLYLHGRPRAIGAALLRRYAPTLFERLRPKRGH